MLNDKRVVVVLPTYNERETIGQLIKELLGLSPLVTVLVVDDNSPDETGQLVRRLAQQSNDRLHLLSRTERLGFGSASLLGLREALKSPADCIISMDADSSHRPEDIPGLVEAAARHGLVIGSRYLPEASFQGTRWRRFLSRNANRYVKAILCLESVDCTSGFRVYRPETLSACSNPIRSTGFAFLVEMLERIVSEGHSVGEVPIHYRARPSGKSKMSARIVLESILLPWRLLFVRWYQRLRQKKGTDDEKLEPGSRLNRKPKILGREGH